MIANVNDDAEKRMVNSIDVFKEEINKIRTGRANTGLLAHIKVDYYGNITPLNQVASITVTDATTLTVSPWEKLMVQPIEKAIVNANLGLNPVVSGMIIRVPLPPLSEERRKELIRVVRGEAEKARVAIRNIRRDANNEFKELVKEKLMTEDEEKRGQQDIQKLTNKYITDVDNSLANKEKELLEI